MPTVAIVEGVKVQLYAQEHPPPHFHAVFAEYRAQIDIESLQLMKGTLPPAKLRAIISWARPRRAALRRGWDMVASRRMPEKIT
jgi:hypothetical protein